MSEGFAGQVVDVIEVAAYSQRYSTAVHHLLITEGGAKVVNDPVDRGGITKWGISLRFLASEGAFDADGDGKLDFDLDMSGEIDGKDIKLLTSGDAVYIYHRCFWDKMDCDAFPAPIGEMLFDQGVNGGRAAACKLLQITLNTCLDDGLKKFGARAVPGELLVDGALGTKTREAMDWVLRYPALGMTAIVTGYRAATRQRYRDIVARNPSQKRFLNGWLARANNLGRV